METDSAGAPTVRHRPKASRTTGVPPVAQGQDAHGTMDNRRDAEATFRVRRGARLPHWTREGATYAVVFGLYDCVPRHVLEALREEERALLGRVEQQNRRPTEQWRQRLCQLRSKRLEKLLAAGHGVCWLRKDEIAEVVAHALKLLDAERYHLLAWCVMPNHVHVVVEPIAGNDLPGILHSWKSFTAKKANKILKRTGPFWQAEYYDHLVRDDADLAHCIEYAWYNPERAGFPDWEWRGIRTTGLPPVADGQDAHGTRSGP